jgi:hypothetical protein
MEGRKYHIQSQPVRLNMADGRGALHRWLRKEKEEKDARKAAELAAGGKPRDKINLAEWNNGWAPGRLTSSLAGSSNTVMRM